MSCAVVGCERSAKKGRKGMCDSHYMRMYRHGTTDRLVVAKPYEHTSGYMMVPAYGHPLARGGSHAYEHRLVYYNAHGQGPFSCYWCGLAVTWDAMHIDHLDDDKKNNNIANLVASCSKCNMKRGAHKTMQKLRASVGVEALGRRMTLGEWSKETGLSRASLKARLQHMTPDEAMTLPRGRFGPRPKGRSGTCDSLSGKASGVA